MWTWNAYGVSPTLTVVPGERTKITLGYEYFNDRRAPIEAFLPSRAPLRTPISTFFGNPDDSHVRRRWTWGRQQSSTRRDD